MNDRNEYYVSILLSAIVYLVIFEFAMNLGLNLFETFSNVFSMGYYLVLNGEYRFNEVIDFVASLAGFIFVILISYYFIKIFLVVLQDINEVRKKRFQFEIDRNKL